MTGAHFVTHVMLVAYAAIVPWVRDDFDLVSNTQMFSPITFTLFIYGVIAVGTGYLADRYEPLKMLTLGLVVSTIASFGIALSVNLWMLVACFSLLGAGLGFYHPVGLSYISKVFGPKHRGKALGINGIGGNSGWLISPIATAAIAVLLVYEHRLVSPDDLTRVNRAFFHVNAVVGIGLFAPVITYLIGTLFGVQLS